MTQARRVESPLVAAKMMRRAIARYAQVPNVEALRLALQAELDAFERRSMDEMRMIEGPEIDVPEYAARAAADVSGPSSRDALFVLAFELVLVADRADLSARADAGEDEFSVAALFDTSIVDGEGRQVASVPSSLDTDEKAQEVRRRQHCVRALAIHHAVAVAGLIEPARQAIVSEHPEIATELTALAGASPLLADGHESIFVRGLQAGLQGDWLVALHLPVAQYESCLRHVLEQSGVSTTRPVTLRDAPQPGPHARSDSPARGRDRSVPGA